MPVVVEAVAAAGVAVGADAGGQVEVRRTAVGAQLRGQEPLVVVAAAVESAAAAADFEVEAEAEVGGQPMRVAVPRTEVAGLPLLIGRSRRSPGSGGQPRWANAVQETVAVSVGQFVVRETVLAAEAQEHLPVRDKQPAGCRKTKRR